MLNLSITRQALGGRAALGATVRTLGELNSLVQAGLPDLAVEAFKSYASLSDPTVAALLGVSEKTLSRTRSSTRPLDSVASDRLVRAARLVALAVEVLEDRGAALRWLKRPQIGLNGLVPMDLLTTDIGSSLVEQLLLRIEHGVYS